MYNRSNRSLYIEKNMKMELCNVSLASWFLIDSSDLSNNINFVTH